MFLARRGVEGPVLLLLDRGILDFQAFC
eukprot:COSAG02_NODE_59917_length_273_cov_0.402299_1_plen_27_part_10